jgi:multidrug efflux pump subunit AcrA (membrane-fusion protein)
MRTILALCFVLSLAGCSSPPTTRSAEQKLALTSVSTSPSTIDTDIRSSVSINPYQDETRAVVFPMFTELVFAPQTGRLIDLPVGEGHSVNKGDVLARFDPKEYEFSLEENKAKLQLAEVNIKRQNMAIDAAKIDQLRMNELYQAGIISERELERARMAVSDKEAELEGIKIQLYLAEGVVKRSQENLQRLIIRSPRNGTILRRYCEIGGSVVAGERLFEIISTSQLGVRFRLAIAHGRLRLGDHVAIYTNEGLAIGKAVIRSIAPTAVVPKDALEYQAEVLAAENLLPGMIVLVKVI